MHSSNASHDAPGSPASPVAGSPQSRWELDAALAVLARAREDWAALAPGDASALEQHAAQQRVQSALRLVARIRGKLSDSAE